jgi:hypothetical protein
MDTTSLFIFAQSAQRLRTPSNTEHASQGESYLENSVLVSDQSILNTTGMEWMAWILSPEPTPINMRYVEGVVTHAWDEERYHVSAQIDIERMSRNAIGTFYINRSDIIDV